MLTSTEERRSSRKQPCGLLRKSADQINYTCILLEGLFNSLGTDILGMATIVPLFLAEFGASLPLIGSLTTLQSVLSAVTPLLAGGFLAAASSKRRLSLIFNGISRGLILLIPLSLLLGLPGPLIVGIFFGIMAVYFAFQPITGITWNHLLGDCVEARRRGKLVGTLFALSGFITFASSNIIKLIRESGSLSPSVRYAIIFGLAGVLMASSVLFFLPLRETRHEGSAREERNVKAYLKELLGCFQNRDYDRLLLTNCFSHMSVMVNSFLYLFAQNHLGLSTPQISNLLILQTVGVVAGGFSTGRISSRFGSKRMLMLVEGLGFLVPVLALVSMGVPQPYFLMAAAVFLMGFSKSGYLGYQTHLLEIVQPEKRIYHIVTKSLVLLPCSLVGMLAGFLLEHFSPLPLFLAQLVLAALAVLCASRLRLIVYPKSAQADND